MRKLILLLVTAVLAIVAMPILSADAAASDGNAVGCYTIRKSGNYNDVKVAVNVHQKGKSVGVYGFVAVTKACQKANSIPIARISIYHARLKDAKTGQVLRLSGSSQSRTKSMVSSKTAFKYAACGRQLIASAEVGYAYTDGSYVKRFYVHGHTFVRC